MSATSDVLHRRPFRHAAIFGAFFVLVLDMTALAWAQAPASSAVSAGSGLTAAGEALGFGALEWRSLSPSQRETLKPLMEQWSALDPQRQQKWLRLAERLSSMGPEERARVEARMVEWARMTPAQRGQARLRFQEAKQMPSADRRSRWEQYEALTPAEKSELAARAAAPAAAEVAKPNSSRPSRRAADASASTVAAGQGKSNIVPNPALAGALRPVSPTVVQAGPGATTTLITRRPAPPAHQQTGLPKITATPEFVHGATLLPKRGPQGAAVEAPRLSGAESGFRAMPHLPAPSAAAPLSAAPVRTGLIGSSSSEGSTLPATSNPGVLPLPAGEVPAGLGAETGGRVAPQRAREDDPVGPSTATPSVPRLPAAVSAPRP